MSKRGREGKRIWPERGPSLAQEISGQIATESAERMAGWERSGRVPVWIRIKAWLRGRRIDMGPGVDPRERDRD